MESVPHLSFHFRYLRKVSWKDPYPFHMGRLLTAQQAAALLGTSKPTLRALIDRKVLVATKKTRGSGFQWVIREESVEAFLADHGRYDVDMDVEVYGNTGSQKMGFNIGYDSMAGYAFRDWKWVEPGEGWKKYTFRLTDASFADAFSDFRINALGSKDDICVRSVTVRRLPHVPASSAPPSIPRAR